MGGVAVLRPQDCLIDPLPRDNLSYSPMKSPRNPRIPNPNSMKSNREKLSPKGLYRKTAATVVNQPAKNLVMEEVKILKRGEALKELTSTKDRVLAEKNLKEKNLKGDVLDELMLSSTDRLGPAPEMVPKQIKHSDFYAGSAVIESPPPSSLPLPAFFTKKAVFKKHDPTSDLRRILGLDLP